MSATGNTNPGNFANRPTEEVKEIAAKVMFSYFRLRLQSMDNAGRNQASPACLSNQLAQRSLQDLKTSLLLWDATGTLDSDHLYPLTAPSPKTQ
jgi:hypothetical protein